MSVLLGSIRENPICFPTVENMGKSRSYPRLKDSTKALTTCVLVVMLIVLAGPGIPNQLSPGPSDVCYLSTKNQAAVVLQAQADPMARITFIATNSDSLIDDFSFMAAVPTAAFRYGGHQYLSPIVFHTQSDSERWLVEDWVEYLAPDGGITQGVSVGDIPDSSLFNLQKLIGAPIYPRVKGITSAEIASRLALMDWDKSDIAVFALANDTLDPLIVSEGSVSHTFVSDPVIVQTPSASVSSSDPVYIAFTPPAGTGWIEGSINWTGNEYFTHTLVDPRNATVDYSIHSQVYGERFFTQNPVPLYFWVPNSADGEWNLILHPETEIRRTIPLDCQIKYHRGFSQVISVPSSARWLNVSTDWNNAGTNLDLALIDPAGRLGSWAPSGSILSSPGLKSVSLPYPMAGDWTVVVAWMDSTTERNDVTLSWKTAVLQANLQAYLESAANGAVLASLLNVPLLYVTRDSIPTETMWAAERLGVNRSFLVDPDNVHSQAVADELGLFSVVTNLNDYQLVSSKIRELSARNDVVITVPTGTGDELFAPAALSAAVHGSPVLSLCGDDNLVTTRAEETWAPYLIGPDIEVYVTTRYTSRTENGWYDERIPNEYSMTLSAASFEQFLVDRGAYNATESQQVVVISSLDNIKPSFDRALQCNFTPGRIPTDDPALASVLISRAALHRFLFSTAESVDHALLTLYAYTDGAGYVDNFHNVYEIRQIENSISALEPAGFSIDSHVGYSEVFAALAAQPSFWSLSTHGTLTSYPTDPPERPDGLGLFSLRNQDASYGFEISPTVRESPTDGDQLVNPVGFQAESVHHIIKATADLEASIKNIGSPIVILTACLLGGTGLPEMLMKHGAVSVIASPRTVYFQPAGLLSILITRSLAASNTTGYALNKALRAVSYDYSSPPAVDPTDYANQQILFGDPEIRLYNSVTNPHIAAVNPTQSTFGSHMPGRGLPSVAAVGSSSYLPTSLNSLNISNDYYETSNYTAFLWSLPLRHVVLFEPGSLSVLANTTAVNIRQLAEYVYSGGSLVLFGVTGNTTWMPWPVVVDGSASGPSITVTDPGHPLMSSPNIVGNSTGYQGYFSSVWANLSVIATDGAHPVAVAGLVGYGKMALTTTYPAGVDRDATVENAALWSNEPSLYLNTVTMNEYVIWTGDRVVITLHITDLIGRNVEGVNVRVWLNSSHVEVQESGNGIYVVTLSEQWTSNRSGLYDLEIGANKSGYDTMSRLLPHFVYIRALPWLVIGVIGAVAATMIGGWLYFRHRRGESLIPRRHRAISSQDRERERKEKERQREKDQKVNPSEFFGV